jgi:hypothetical protein
MQGWKRGEHIKILLNICDTLAEMRCRVFRGTEGATSDVKAFTVQGDLGEAVPIWHTKTVLCDARL